MREGEKGKNKVEQKVKGGGERTEAQTSKQRQGRREGDRRREKVRAEVEGRRRSR